jgi:hypothetical protein
MAGRHEFPINGNKFYIRRYDPFLSLTILGEVQKKFLPPLASLMEANDTGQGEENRMRAAMEAIEKVSKSLDGPSLVALVKIVLNQDYVSVVIDNAEPIRLDEGALNRSCEDISEVITLVMEVLRFNYEKLFTQGRNLIGREQPQVESQ